MKSKTPVYPAQCGCGHLYFEKYEFKEVTKEGNHGFCWCGFCSTKFMVKAVRKELPQD